MDPTSSSSISARGTPGMLTMARRSLAGRDGSGSRCVSRQATRARKKAAKSAADQRPGVVGANRSSSSGGSPLVNSTGTAGPLRRAIKHPASGARPTASEPQPVHGPAAALAGRVILVGQSKLREQATQRQPVLAKLTEGGMHPRLTARPGDRRALGGDRLAQGLALIHQPADLDQQRQL